MTSIDRTARRSAANVRIIGDMARHGPQVHGTRNQWHEPDQPSAGDGTDDEQ